MNWLSSIAFSKSRTLSERDFFFLISSDAVLAFCLKQWGLKIQVPGEKDLTLCIFGLIFSCDVLGRCAIFYFWFRPPVLKGGQQVEWNVRLCPFSEQEFYVWLPSWDANCRSLHI